ncbi:hypothetical protein LBC_11360 [Campylobacter sp. 19-13652]|nr:hypothetical protein LBC_11360 [Campylobacter sp. 19-13652]
MLTFLSCKEKVKVIKKMLGINLFLILIFLSYIYAQKFELAYLSFIRSNLTILFIVSLFSALSSAHIAAAMAKIGAPYKLTVVLFLAVKFIEQFFIDLVLFKQRLLARGLKPATNRLTYKAYSSFIALLIFMGFSRAQMAKECIIARGFNNLALKKIYKEKLNALDFFWCVKLIVFMVLEILWTLYR